MEEAINNGRLDPHYIGYQLLTKALKNPNMLDGISKSLECAKSYLNATDIFLYRLEDHDEYEELVNQAVNNDHNKVITEVLNKAKSLIEVKNNFTINITNNEISNLTFVQINLNNCKYVLAITNINENNNTFNDFLNVMKESLTIILNNYENYKNMLKISYNDSLTGLYNRSAYNNTIKEMDNNNEYYAYAIIDLFRLKYINDNHSHAAGDKYITETAEVLKKYFPKTLVLKDENGVSKKVDTGCRVYRIGGDEFVIISNKDDLATFEIKMQLASEDVKMLNLGIEDPNAYLGLNYGLAERTEGKTSEQLYLEADQKLFNHKRDMYINLGINRRK